jgi:hypothetical protein
MQHRRITGLRPDTNGFRIHVLRDQRRHALAADVRCQRRGCGTRVPRTGSVVEEQQGLVSVGVKLNLEPVI